MDTLDPTARPGHVETTDAVTNAAANISPTFLLRLLRHFHVLAVAAPLCAGDSRGSGSRVLQVADDAGVADDGDGDDDEALAVILGHHFNPPAPFKSCRTTPKKSFC